MKSEFSRLSLDEKMKTCTLHVCTSCRAPETPREPQEGRQGFILFQKLQEAVKNSNLKDRVDVKAAKCLSVCPRPCGIAISSSESWTYLFGDQEAHKTIQDIIDCVSLYLGIPNGFMNRADRPKSLRRSILGRIPPIEGI